MAGLRQARPVAGRWPAAAVGLAGVALVVPSMVGPTWLQTVGDRERGDLLSEERQWSWGRVDLSGLTGVALDQVPNPVGLVVAVALLVLGFVGVVAWLLVPGRRVVLAVVALALLTGRVLTTSAERQGRGSRELPGSESGLTVVNGSMTAGWLETASVVVLLTALVLMAVSLVGPRTVPEPSPVGLQPEGRHLGGPEVGLSDEAPR